MIETDDVLQLDQKEKNRDGSKRYITFIYKNIKGFYKMVSIEVKMSAVSWTESWESVNNYSHRTKNQNIKAKIYEY